MKYLYIFVAILICFICACQKNDDEIKNIKSKLTDLEKKYEKLDSSFRMHDFEQFFTETKEKRVFLDLDSEPGYLPLNVEPGLTFLIALDDVENFLNGYKVRIKIGNIYSTTFKGGNLKVSWGKYYEKEKEFEFQTSIKSNTWNKISFNVTPFDPIENNTIRLEMEINTIFMYN
jgi:hypothetical protein